MLAESIILKAKGWLNKNEADGSHKEIIDIYNSHKPLARGYKVKYTDSWCATFVSAVAISCGATDIIPLECSCGRMIELAEKKGIWVENDAHIPSTGDIIMYDWGDSGNGDTSGWPEHVGYVVSVNNGKIKVIEGNLNNSVAYREIAINGRYIRGYICPKYEIKENEVKTMRYFKLNEEMNIRSTPNGTKVGVAPEGAVISGSEFATNNGIEWLKTTYNGIEGYIAVLPATKGYAVETDAPKTSDLKKAVNEARDLLLKAEKILSEAIK